jgi:hypothetical protein
MSMWYSLRGPLVRQSGVSGSVTIPAGAKVLRIHAFAVSASTIAIFTDADAITLPANSGWFVYQANHLGLQAPTGNNTIVFSSTASYFVEYSVEGT